MLSFSNEVKVGEKGRLIGKGSLGMGKKVNGGIRFLFRGVSVYNYGRDGVIKRWFLVCRYWFIVMLNRVVY